MPSWPSSSASLRDSCDSEPLHSGSVSPERPISFGESFLGLIDEDGAAEREVGMTAA